MKNISMFLNIVLLLAVATLYYFEFTDSNDGTTAKENLEKTESSDNLSIAYVNSDTLLQSYDFYNELNNKLDKKREKLENEFRNRAAGLQRQFEDYKKTVNNMTIAQAQVVEEDLGRKQQNLRQYQESLTQELMKEEAKITQDLYDKVSAYLKTYGEENNLQLVLTYTQGSGVLYANQGMNITSEITEGLNRQYSLDNSKTDKADSTRSLK